MFLRLFTLFALGDSATNNKISCDSEKLACDIPSVDTPGASVAHKEPPLIPSFESQCPIRSSYLNKHSDPANAMAGRDKVKDRRKEVQKNVDDLNKGILTQLNELEDEISTKDLTSAAYTRWASFIKSVADASVHKRSHELGKGACGEAARTSVTNTLLKQLETGSRESIQEISLEGGVTRLNATHSITNPDHVFVIYNSEPISSRTLSGTAELGALLKNVKPLKPTKPVIICDAWLGFHGPAEDWLTHFQNDKAHIYGNVNWKKLGVTDYSIPSTKGIAEKTRESLFKLTKNTLQPNSQKSKNIRKKYRAR